VPYCFLVIGTTKIMASPGLSQSVPDQHTYKSTQKVC